MRRIPTILQTVTLVEQFDVRRHIDAEKYPQTYVAEFGDSITIFLEGADLLRHMRARISQALGEAEDAAEVDGAEEAPI